MSIKTMVKIFFCFCLATAIVTGLIHSSDPNSAVVPETQNLLPVSLNQDSFRHDPRTKSEILAQMNANGWLRTGHSEWFVSPGGKSSGQGTIDSPFDLKTAVTGTKNGKEIAAGDVVWLRGGTYRGSFDVRIGGKNGIPLHFRQFPGERAFIDKAQLGRKKGTLNIRHPNNWFWDFEVINSSTDRRRLDGEGEMNPVRGSGVNIWSPNVKLINLSIHDNGHGVGIWTEEGSVEIYGCLIFNNGNNKKEHGIYAHNKKGVHRITNNIVFNNAGYGLHVYANSIKRSIQGFDIRNNTLFKNGVLTLNDQAADQILVGGVEGVSANRISLRNNIVYTEPTSPNNKSRGIRLGYRHKKNGDVILEDNLIVGRVPLKVLWWESIRACRNSVVSAGRGIEIETPPGTSVAKYTFGGNHFTSNGKTDRALRLNGKKSDLGIFRRQTSRGDCSSNSGTLKTVFPRVNITQNKYDQSLVKISVYNPGGKDAVSLNLGSYLENGQGYRIWDAQSSQEGSLLRGVFDGSMVRLALKRSKVVQPIGNTERMPTHTGPEFSVFVLRKESLH